MQRRLPVLHLRVRFGPAEQPVRARALEELLDAAVGERAREVDVLADHVEQTAEAIARLRQARVGLLAPRDVGDDAADHHGPVRPPLRAGAVLDRAGDAVEAQQPVFRLGVLAAQQGGVEPLVDGPVVGMDARLPELARRHALGELAADEARPRRRGRVADVVAVRGDLTGVDLLLEEVEDARNLPVSEPKAGGGALDRAPGSEAQRLDQDCACGTTGSSFHSLATIGTSPGRLKRRGAHPIRAM
jgi:hypothetical protein